ncbi:MAG: magnesium transporter [Phycisphaerae bacterium]
MKQLLLVPELRELLAAGDTETLREFCAETHPATVAELLSGLEADEIWRILHLLGVADRAEIFSHFDLDQQAELATGENRRAMAKLLEEMDPDERADLFQRLDETLRDELLPLVAKAEREDIRKLVAYAEGTAGAVMTTDFAALKPGTRVRDALDQIRRQAPAKETVYYIYVVDDTNKLIGFVSLRDLILARPDQTVGDVMDEELISVNVNDDQEEVARSIEKFDLIAIPVVNSDNKLLGIVTHDDAMDILRQEQQEDVEKLMAITGRHESGEYLRTSTLAHFRNRVVWVVALGMLGLVSGMIIQNFEGLLMQFAILAAFIPMLADTGGNTGSQSATLIVRALALQEVRPRDIAAIVFKEFRVAILLAIVLAAVAYGRVLFLAWGATVPQGYTLERIGLAVSVALGLQVISATLIGAILPLAAAKLRRDPALVASPALTTMVDITGLIIYFSTVKLILNP